MRTRTSRLAQTFLVATFFTTACAEQASEPGASRAESEVRSTQATVAPENIRPEERFLFELEAKSPGFGGFHVDEQGVIHLWVKGDGDGALAVSEIRQAMSSGVLLRSRGAKIAGTVTHAGQFSISELARWRDQLFEAVNNGQFTSAVSLDLDERANRVSLLLHDAGELGIARSRLHDLAIPPQAVQLRLGTRAVEVVARAAAIPNAIYDQADTLVGGIGMGWSPASQDSSVAQSGCTIGFVSSLGGGSFVTASHCSSFQWGADSSRARQQRNYRQVGFEVQDQSGYSCGFRTCRGSDASRYSVSGVASEAGLIARMSGDGSRLWSTSVPHWKISAVEQSTWYVGFGPVRKNGETTGQTSGYVSFTCVDIWPNSFMTYTCQVKASAAADAGDSGGPVFFENGDGPYFVTLGGVVSTSDGDGLSFSPFQRIVANMSGLTAGSVIHPTTAPPPQAVVTGSIVNGYPQLSWSPVSGAVSYRIERMWIRRSTDEVGGPDYFEGVTSPFSDNFLTVDLYSGSNSPSIQSEGHVSYRLIVTNGYGASSSVTKYFRLAP